MITTDILILGSGPAGCTAALYAARAGLKPLVLEGPQPGGQLTQTTDIENYPGHTAPINGYDLVLAMREQAERFGATFEMDEATAIEDAEAPVKTVQTIVNGPIRCRALVIATGATARWLGLPGEQRLIGRGLSACATCDGAFYKGKTVAVVGGGDVACEDALFLTRHAAKIYLIHRRDALRASKIMADRLLGNPAITPIWDTTVTALHAAENGTLGAVTLRNVKDGSTRELPLDGLFVAIGHTPNTAFLQGVLHLTPQGYIQTHDGIHTSIPGIYAAGDVMDPDYKQAIVAAGAGAKAALAAERHLLGE